MTDFDLKYFPERFVFLRNSFKKTFKKFKDDNFEEDYYNRDVDVYHSLREHIRRPVSLWNKSVGLPEYMELEREDILSRLHKNEVVLPQNPTKEEYSSWLEYQEKLENSKEWEEWSNWVDRAQDMIVVYPKLEQETSINKSLILFYQSGRNIFDVSIYLRNLLENTSVLDIRYNDFVLPYKTVYFHFGLLKSIFYPVECIEEKFNIYIADGLSFQSMEDEDEFYKNKKYYLEGAFVSVTNEHSINIQLCFNDFDSDYSNKVSVENDNRFVTFNFSLDFGKWDEISNKMIYDSDITFEESTITFSNIWDEKESVEWIGYDFLNELISNPEKCSENELIQYLIIDNSLKLIVNSICYLNTNDKDIEVSATKKDVIRIIDELKHSKKTRVQNNLKTKLSKFSYSNVYLLGQNLKKYIDSQLTGVEVEPHWRRGHWRNQPFGENLSKKKLIWIKPTIVRKDKGSPQKGHVYKI